MNEADTCRIYVILKLHASGWEGDYIIEQFPLTPGWVVLVGTMCGSPARGRCRKSRLGHLKVCFVKELRPLFGRALTSSPCGMPSVLDRAFKGEL
jgi:hypothetical protein